MSFIQGQACGTSRLKKKINITVWKVPGERNENTCLLLNKVLERIDKLIVAQDGNAFLSCLGL